MCIAILKKKNSQLTTHNSQLTPSVSVIICAKNEVENLQKNLPFILEQNYLNFEVIIISDNSTDNTNEIIKAQQLITNNLFLITISKEEKIGLGKKYALQKGIEAAKNELILLTDADCAPISKNWILEMVHCIDDEKKIALGISPYKTKNTLLNALIEYETAQTAMQYLGFAILGNAYMSVGRNVLYDASLLKKIKWTKEEYAVASGDDDLAIQRLSNIKNTTICLSKNSYTYSESKDTWRNWFYQKTRHYETGKLYKISHQLFLGSYLITKFLMYFFLAIGCLIGIPFLYKMLCFYLLFITVSNFILNYKLSINSRWQFSVFADIGYAIVTVFLGIYSLVTSTKVWK